jgi:threonine dehydrogenase-like Zn-dependent dehydrogenase
MGTRNALPQDFQEVITMLEQNRFPVDSAISAIVKMEAAAEILAAWDADPGRYTKIMLSLD